MSSTIRNEEDNFPTKGNEEESFEDMLAASFKTAPQVKIGEKVEAMVVAIDKENIYLEMGTRVEGFLNKAEFTEDGELTVQEGQKLHVFIVGKSHGIFRCKRYLGDAESESPGIRDESIYLALQDAYENSQRVEGKVKSASKSGFEVLVMGQKAFCPISQIDSNYCDNPDAHLNKGYTFKIIELAEEGKNIVLSRKEVLVEEDEKKAEKLWQHLELGAIYDGTVTAVKNYGAFVDIGGIEGLLHVSEISYSRIEDAQTVLKAGQDLDVEIITIDRDKRKVGFSLKKQLEDPWIEGIKKIAVGKEVLGKVVRLKPYGAFVEIMPGVDGLLHVSQLGTGKRHEHPKEVVKTGEVVKVWIKEIDESKRNISLTMQEPERSYQDDLDKIQQDQDQQVKEKGSHFAGLFDSALEEKDQDQDQEKEKDQEQEQEQEEEEQEKE
jgi:small subunit ribosomal protein S1